MKFLFFVIYFVQITLCASPDDFIVITTPPEHHPEPTAVSLDSYTYIKNGKDWPGLCMTGVHQSPINIINKINTQDDPHSHIQFLYHIEKEYAESYQKLKYDGRGLSLKADIGSMVFTHPDGTQEFYEANQIDFHYPSEHTITMNSQTPRYPLEVHIVHRLIRTTNRNTTDQQIQVKKAVVSILFKGNSIVSEGDPFLSELGIDNRLKRPDGSFRTVNKGEEIDSSDKWLGCSKPGFDINSLIFLKDILNFDHWIFRYYGSDTEPPCTEDVHRFVFAIPRSANKVQIDFLKAQLMKQRENINSKDEELTLDIFKYYGNNRSLQIYDDASNGKVFSMKNGISQIEGVEFPKSR